MDAFLDLTKGIHELLPAQDEHTRLWRKIYQIILEWRSIDFDPKEDVMRATDLMHRCVLVIYEILDYAELFIESDEAAQEFALAARNKQLRIDVRLTSADSLLLRVKHIRERHQAIRKMKPQYWTAITPTNHFIDSEGNDYDVSQETSELIRTNLKKMNAGQPVFEDEIRPLIPESYKGNVGKYFGMFNKNLEKRGFLAECLVRSVDASKELRFWGLNFKKLSKPENPQEKAGK